MKHYDPEIAPDSVEWLEMGEKERIALVEGYHRKQRVELPNIKVHAVLHAVVENQIAEELDSVVQAMDRLMAEGLSRHEALHAIGCVMADHLYEVMNAKDEKYAASMQSRYDADLNRLTVKEWREKGGQGPTDH